MGTVITLLSRTTERILEAQAIPTNATARACPLGRYTSGARMAHSARAEA